MLFRFGGKKDIYNPWSVINFLSEKRTGAYWGNTSANSLVDKLLRESRPDIKQTFEDLLSGRYYLCGGDGAPVLCQIERKNYEANLAAKGIPGKRIRKYGFTFCGKKVLIGENK